jgi:hypothetical protein
MAIAVNVDRFPSHPVHALVALLPDAESAQRAVDNVAANGHRTDDANLLVGPEGLAVFDVDGRQHGFAARLLRALQHLGSAENALHVWADGLQRGEALLTLPCEHDAAPDAAQVLRQEGGHTIAYFGRHTFEALDPPG